MSSSWISSGRSRVSGHSKWSSIKHKKGAADARRGKLFSKLSRAIIVAAREGGGDPAANLALQNAIEKARSYSMPKDNIERAIARGAGNEGDGDAYEPIVYEGYGPSGVALIVEALTDNRNRTAAEVRHIFDKHDGSLGGSGSVAWLFERRGVVLVPADGADEDELTMAAADGGADDVGRDGRGYPRDLADGSQVADGARPVGGRRRRGHPGRGRRPPGQPCRRLGPGQGIGLDRAGGRPTGGRQVERAAGPVDARRSCRLASSC